MIQPNPRPNAAPAPRNWWGWISLVLMFGLVIPAAITSSFKGTDAKSKDPAVQAGNLEAIVEAETPKDNKTKELEGVVRAVEGDHLTDEDASAVYAATMMELRKTLGSSDLALLAKSTHEGRRATAELYASPTPAPDEVRKLVTKLPKDRFLYNLARAQSLERIGDHSARQSLSPQLDEAALKHKLIAPGILFSLALLGGCFVLVGYVAAIATGAIKWRGHPLEPASLPEADRLAVKAAQLFGAFLFLQLAVADWSESFKGSKSAAGAMVVEIVSASVVIIGTVLVTRVPVGNRAFRLADYGFRRDMIRPALLWGVGGFLAVIPLASVGIMVGQLFERFAPRPDHPLIHMLEDSHNLLYVGGAFFLASVQAPFTEELLFRGTLTPALSGLFGSRKYAVPLAIGLSSLVFASIHPQGFTLWLALASIGVVNGVMCYQTRSVLPGMVMHALFNASILTFTLITR